MKSSVSSKGAPNPGGPYSQGVAAEGWVFCSGQLGIDSATGQLVAGGIEAETRRVLANLREVLEAAGLSLNDVVKTTVFLADLKEFEAMNRIYREHFKEPFPARSTVQVAALGRGARIEVEAIACRPR
ncbi:MAG TPA: RidA family protein [Candidatus Binataceae bacterium]|nr:RidA family protein [Candidatus Binataceae bacterium]